MAQNCIRATKKLSSCKRWSMWWTHNNIPCSRLTNCLLSPVAKQVVVTCLTVLGLRNMCSGHSPLGRARAFSADVFCPMVKCVTARDASALDSLLNSTMVTSDVKLLHEPITIVITSRTTATTTSCVRLPRDYSAAIAQYFHSFQGPGQVHSHKKACAGRRYSRSKSLVWTETQATKQDVLALRHNKIKVTKRLPDFNQTRVRD